MRRAILAKGTERLRLATTPHHTKEMMDEFVENITQLWTAPLHTACETCNTPLNTVELFNSSNHVCQLSNCTYSSVQHVQAIVA